MHKFSNYSIVASFLGLWINSFLEQRTQIFIGFLLIFSFGILHGANDLLLIGRTKSYLSDKPFYKILLNYITIVIIGSLLFYFLPLFALLLFIIVSGYHFGEQHWHNLEQKKTKKTNIIFHLFYGLLILNLIFIFNISEVQRIMHDITSIHISTERFYHAFYFVISGFLLLCLIKYFQSTTFKKVIVQEILLLFVFAIIFKTSTLIWSFTIYFILWHSIPSMMDQINFLYGSTTYENFKKYFSSAFLYWIISLLGISVLYLMFKNEYFFDALFFSFLAAITFPHVWVIVNMFKAKKISN